ncbi:22946_t:CDS:2, partial [Cetraspora pellucida]
QIRKSGRVQAIHHATKAWVNALETFCADVGYSGKIEDINDKNTLENQLFKFIHLNEKSIFLKPINLLNPKAFYLFNKTLNGKLKSLASKGLGEHNKADSLTLHKVQAILSHSSLQKSTPKGLLKHTFFYNFIFLVLHEEIDVQLFNSKTNQYSLDNPKAQAKLLSLSNIKDIIDNYNFYIIKRPSTALNTGLDLTSQQISNHSGHKTSVQVLKELGYSNAVVISIT